MGVKVSNSFIIDETERASVDTCNSRIPKEHIRSQPECLFRLWPTMPGTVVKSVLIWCFPCQNYLGELECLWVLADRLDSFLTKLRLEDDEHNNSQGADD